MTATCRLTASFRHSDSSEGLPGSSSNDYDHNVQSERCGAAAGQRRGVSGWRLAITGGSRRAGWIVTEAGNSAMSPLLDLVDAFAREDGRPASIIGHFLQPIDGPYFVGKGDFEETRRTGAQLNGPSRVIVRANDRDVIAP